MIVGHGTKKLVSVVDWNLGAWEFIPKKGRRDEGTYPLLWTLPKNAAGQRILSICGRFDHDFMFQWDFNHNVVSLLSAKPGKQLTECQRRYQHAISHYTPHAMIPQCKPDGSFKAQQCDMLYCYCVDSNGVEIPDTRLNVRYGRPVCDDKGTIHMNCVATN